MRTSGLLFCLFTRMAVSQANPTGDQEGRTIIPADVKKSFETSYPGVKPKWSKEKNDFEAEFTLKGVETSVTYDRYGRREEIEVAIPLKDFPVSAKDYLDKNYPKVKIIESTKITGNNNVITYEAEIKKDGKEKDILFNSEGEFIKITNGD